MARLLVVAGLAVLSAACQAKTALSPAQSAAIADSVRALTDSVLVNAEKVNLEATFQRFSADSDAVHINVGRRFTKDSLVAWFRTAFAAVDSQQIDHRNVTVTVLGPDAAVWSADGHAKAFFKNGDVQEGDVASTFVWVRREGRWTVLDWHQSFPPRPVSE